MLERASVRGLQSGNRNLAERRANGRVASRLASVGLPRTSVRRVLVDRRSVAGAPASFPTNHWLLFWLLSDRDADADSTYQLIR